MPHALTVAGSDSSGGAGIQADLRTFEAHGVHGLSAITAVTAQSSTAVRAVEAVSPSLVRAQIDAATEGTDVRAIKTGMLATAAIVEIVAEAVTRLARPLVVDPVILASDGTPLLEAAAVEVLKTDLLPWATCVTPNLPEAAHMTGCDVTTTDGRREAARRLVGLGPRAVVITGGHIDGAEATDLFYDGREFVEVGGRRLTGASMHGSGCAYSAAVAATLALGQSIEDACRSGKRYVEELLRGGRTPRRAEGALLYSADMAGERFVVTRDVLSLEAVVGTVTPVDRPPGAITSFLGLVRGLNQGRQVLHLEYEGYEPLAVKAFERIDTEARSKWPDVVLALHHRIGVLQVAEASIAIAAASPHRAEAFAGCRYAIERVKQIAPIWKHEYFEGGDVWIEGAIADPEDEDARELAYQRACA